MSTFSKFLNYVLLMSIVILGLFYYTNIVINKSEINKFKNEVDRLERNLSNERDTPLNCLKIVSLAVNVEDYVIEKENTSLKQAEQYQDAKFKKMDECESGIISKKDLLLASKYMADKRAKKALELKKYYNMNKK